MKKILGLTVAALMVMGLVGGGTWAYFSDTETVSSNVMLAGTLDLGLSATSNTSSTGSITGTFSATDWAPGSTENATIYVNNNGNIAMSTVNLTFSHGAITDGTPTTVDDWNGTADSDNLTKMITATTATWGGSPIGSIQGQSLADLAGNSTGYDIGTLDADTETELFIEWTFSTAATNGCQGDTVDLTITVTGTQQ
jgi:predicted ribosomally synthesized peptide with SipW-like signal peptide